MTKPPVIRIGKGHPLYSMLMDKLQEKEPAEQPEVNEDVDGPDMINAVLRRIQRSVLEEPSSPFEDSGPECDEEECCMEEDDTLDNVAILIPSNTTPMVDDEYYVHPDVRQYILDLQDKLAKRNTLAFSIERLLTCSYLDVTVRTKQ